AKAINNYVVNVCIGSIWSSMLYGNLYLYYFMRSIVKNTLLLPLEVILLVLLFNLLGRTLKARGFLHADTSFPIPFLTSKTK
ncbi:MAG: folate family ECF transporter S component, partial [Bulleidia sp.]|nr:folate family ECF transporter S component [Bulleidia sp.]